jgi:hypothetical protein
MSLLYVVFLVRLSHYFFVVGTLEIYIILGIGSLWTTTGVTGSRSSNCPYRGPRANAEFQLLSGCNNRTIPTESDGDPRGGTFCGHWDEECLESELMTGELSRTGTIPLSRLTIATLDDLGYTVDYSSAETFTKSNLNLNCQCTQKRQRRARRRHGSILDMSHGDTHQLGLRSSSSSSPPPPRQRRRLSDAAYQMALEYGENILSQRAQEARTADTTTPSRIEDSTAAPTTTMMILNSTRPSSAIVETAAPTIYVGDQFLSVLVEDGGEIYGVIVSSR